MKKIFMAGFGGQGILFMGKFIASAGMLEGYEVTWLPSYGAESRGGTSNCHVIVSKTTIGSPIVLEPDILICMNLPSLNKFENNLVSGGALYVDNSIVNRETTRSGIKVYSIPATKLAYDNDMDGLANMIMLGAVIKNSNVCDKNTVEKAMASAVSATKKDLAAKNIKAIEIGYNYF